MSSGTAPALPVIEDAAWLTSHATQSVFAALESGGHEARAVGGAVRNTLLARLQNKPFDISTTDIDIATTATPEVVTALAEAAGLRVEPTGLSHGTVTVIVAGQPIEVTTLRQDVATDGRRADVAFTTDWTADAQRRDFTMNALYVDRHGNILDPIGGYTDIVQHKIRFIGDPEERIREDYLRILRFFRFFAQYDAGPPDTAGLAATVRCRAGLQRLSRERVRQELLKLLVAERAVDAVETMHLHGLLVDILRIAPRISVFHRMTQITRPESNDGSVLRLAALCIGVDEDAMRVAANLRLSRSETAVLQHVAETVATSPWWQLPSPAEARAWLFRDGKQRYRNAINTHRALMSNSDEDPKWEKLLSLPEKWNPPTFPVKGRDLLALGMQPGQSMGQVLRQLEAYWIAGDFADSREVLLAKAAQMLGNECPG